MSYKSKVLKYMREYGSITNYDAFNYCNITRLGSAIFSLRQSGYKIRTHKVEATNHEGHIFKYARYTLEESEDKNVK